MQVESKKNIPLVSDQIHIWRALMPKQHDIHEVSDDTLSSHERERSLRYGDAARRQRFVVGRATLRRVLSKYLALPPHKVPLISGRHGKPFVTPQPSRLHICFNVSHTCADTVIAVSLGSPIGVDVERIRPLVFDPRMLDLFVTPSERRALDSLSQERRLKGILKCWTSKEAYAKGLGYGLAMPFTGIEVCVDPDKPPQLLGLHSQEWSLLRIDVGDQSMCVIATPRTPSVVVSRLLRVGSYSEDGVQMTPQEISGRAP